jgi:hypothetical protein
MATKPKPMKQQSTDETAVLTINTFTFALIILWLVSTGEPPATSGQAPTRTAETAQPETSPPAAPSIEALQEAPAPPTEAAKPETSPPAAPSIETAEPETSPPAAPSIETAEPETSPPAAPSIEALQEAPAPPTEAAAKPEMSPSTVPTVAAQQKLRRLRRNLSLVGLTRRWLLQKKLR